MYINLNALPESLVEFEPAIKAVPCVTDGRSKPASVLGGLNLAVPQNLTLDKQNQLVKLAQQSWMTRFDKVHRIHFDFPGYGKETNVLTNAGYILPFQEYAGSVSFTGMVQHLRFRAYLIMLLAALEMWRVSHPTDSQMLGHLVSILNACNLPPAVKPTVSMRDGRVVLQRWPRNEHSDVRVFFQRTGSGVAAIFDGESENQMLSIYPELASFSVLYASPRW